MSLVRWPAVFLLHTWYLVSLQNAAVPSNRCLASTCVETISLPDSS